MALAVRHLRRDRDLGLGFRVRIPLRTGPVGLQSALDRVAAASPSARLCSPRCSAHLRRPQGSDRPCHLSLLVLAPIAAVRFVLIERRSADPLVPLHYFRRAGFSGPMIAYLLGHIAYMGGFVISPILLKDVFGYTKLSKITAC